MTNLARKITDAIMDYHDTDAPMTDGAVLGIVQDVLKDHDPIRDINEQLAQAAPISIGVVDERPTFFADWQADSTIFVDSRSPLASHLRKDIGNVTRVDFGDRAFMTATSNGTKTHHMVGDFCHELPGTGWEFAVYGKHHYAVHPDYKPLRLSPNGEQVTLGYLNAQEAAG
jgi:hypothetical protein